MCLRCPRLTTGSLGPSDIVIHLDEWRSGARAAVTVDDYERGVRSHDKG